MKIAGIIPARYKSTRFPGKPLALILGKPMILWVAEISAKALGKENVWVATDDERIKNVVETAGFQVVMTSEDCLTGTDRLYDAAKQISADMFINIQGDEPMLDPEVIQLVADTKKKYPNEVINAMCRLLPDEDPNDRTIPKVLANKHGKMIYMSRLPIPGNKSGDLSGIPFFKQVCVYAFNFAELEAFGKCTQKAEFEAHEDIEILRFFDLGFDVRMVEVKASSIAVDLPEHIQKVEKAMTK